MQSTRMGAGSRRRRKQPPSAGGDRDMASNRAFASTAAASAIALSLVSASTALAQTATAPVGEAPAEQTQTAPANTADDAPVALGDIIVTAQKREQRLQDVPVSITAIQGKQLDDLKITDLRSIQSYVPKSRGAQLGREPGGLHPRLRLGSEQRRLRPGGVGLSRRRLRRARRAVQRAVLRPRADGGAARAAGRAVRSQHRGGRDQPGLGQADQGPARVTPAPAGTPSAAASSPARW